VSYTLYQTGTNCRSGQSQPVRFRQWQADGFESNRSGKRVVWTTDLETGKEKALTDTPSSENLPVISADGSEVAYVITNLPDYKYEMYEIAFEGGPSKKICDTCGQPLQWSFQRGIMCTSCPGTADESRQ
jgi:Tol biopolymer transport system component